MTGRREDLKERIWELEEQYWSAYAAKDSAIERFLRDDFQGWPSSEESPLKGLGLLDHMRRTDYRQDTSKPLFTKKGIAFNDACTVAVAFLLRGTDRVIHTWVQSGDEWELLGGASARGRSEPDPEPRVAQPMYHSGEIRWYFPGDIPRSVREWFESTKLGTSEPARTDQYLYLPNCRTTSVKVREGRLEVKALTAFPEPVEYPNGVSGFRDAWVKWSRRISDNTAFRELIGDHSDDWIFVNKSRQLRKLSLDTGEVTEVDAIRDHPDKGCQVELTSIRSRLEKQTDALPDSIWKECDAWWSLSLEAFGRPSSVQDHLDVAAVHVFQRPPPVRLSEGSSFSYPAWLATLFGQKT